MRILVGLELDNEGRAVAWALDYPGSFAYGMDGQEAVVALARQLVDYEYWVNRHAGIEKLQLGDYDMRIVETWQVYTINEQYDLQEGGYAVNAWFKQDWKPLKVAEIEHGINLLRWSRADLLQILQPLTDAQLDLQYPGERWTIRGIVRHLANAEWWYQERLGLEPGSREQLPKETNDRLAFVRARLVEMLPGLADQEHVVGKDGEFWSPRKLLRRVLWHERDHYQHILKLLIQGSLEEAAL
jgi:hypothetical protein